jgi:DNA polymerase III delta prime subunit
LKVYNLQIKIEPRANNLEQGSKHPSSNCLNILITNKPSKPSNNLLEHA